ncbi:hypothetical protein CP533_3997 [Ophiocordyceps camponoti-saundersi (nom. inval.)]|nr:hypothetical protein CP533_3997 [Ophiocordyceps camponoti-saundersi (nom. inval.)]
MASTGRLSLFQRIVRWLEDWTFSLRLRLGSKIMYDHVRKIVRTSRSELVKGPCSRQELEAMEYVEAHTSVCLPRVHRTYDRREGLFIAMDYIEGTRLDTIWPQLNDADKRGIILQVWDYARQLHACRPPASLKDVTTASLSGGPVRDGILGVDDVGAISAGPFATAEDFHSFTRGNSNVEGFPRSPPHTGLVHADLTPRNMILKPDGRLCIIDWEFAGWWPIYWERVKWHFSDFPPMPDWVTLLDEVSGWTATVRLDSEFSAYV